MPGARSRRTRSRSGSPARRRCQVPLTPTRATTSTRCCAAITDRTKVVVVCTPNNPTGPAVHGDELAAFIDAVPRARRGGDRRGVPRVRHRPRRGRRARARRRPRQRRRAADLLQGVRPGRAAGRVRRRAAAGSPRRSASARCPSGSRRWPRRPRWRRSQPRTHLLARVAELVAERERVVGGACASRAGTVPDAQGNFVWLALGDRTPSSSPRPARRSGRQRAAVRRRRRPRHDRGDRGERHLRWRSRREAFMRVTSVRLRHRCSPRRTDIRW